MNNFDRDKLSNDIVVVTRENIDTPRIALNFFFDSGINRETKPGLATLTGRLLVQGTLSRTAEEIANELESNAIELHVSTSDDYTKISTLFLNEDLEKALDILEDILKNTTFESFEKEVKKLKGEIEASLDSPVKKAQDNLISNIFFDSSYGNTSTKVLGMIDELTKEDVLDFFKQNYVCEKSCISVVGDIKKERILSLLEDKFRELNKCCCMSQALQISPLTENKIVKIVKNDVAQAQVIQGWIVPSARDKDASALTLLNIILGASGLSSRLFLELRDKKGLAYTVRSSYSPYRYSGLFTVYIATEPKNIQIALDGFRE